MPEQTIKLKGWQAIVGVVVIIGIFGVRLMAMDDKKDDKAFCYV